MRGQFRLFPGTRRELVILNNVVDTGEASFLKMITRADVADVASGANFYLGLCGNTFTEATTLATLTGEPAVANGYARQAVSRDATGWPTLDQINGVYRAVTKQVTFAAAGGDFSAAIRRLFICNVSAGGVGILFALSGPLPSDLTLLDGQSLPCTYELYLD